ncbi:Uncharacterised protein [Raoultella ornithinolytica]|nr:Uncharacterised protein [Raoultella ornithinolytica]
MATRWRWPPESSRAVRVSSSGASATRAATASTRARRMAGLSGSKFFQRLFDNLKQGLTRVERGERVLVDELNFTPQLTLRLAT